MSRRIVPVVVFAVFGLGELVHDGYFGEAIEYAGSHRNQLVGSADEGGRFDGQTRQHLQRVFVAERRDDTESSATWGPPYTTLRSVDGECDSLERRRERPPRAVKVVRQLGEKRTDVLGRGPCSQRRQTPEEIDQRCIRRVPSSRDLAIKTETQISGSVASQISRQN